jgi:hypothetical protein
MAMAPLETRTRPIEIRRVVWKSSFDLSAAGKLYAVTGQIDERGSLGDERVRTGEAGFYAREEKTKARESASNLNGWAGHSRGRRKNLKSFLLLSFEIQWSRERLWLDGVKVSGKVLSYPA